MLCISQQTEDGGSPQELHCLVESPSTLEMSTKKGAPNEVEVRETVT